MSELAQRQLTELAEISDGAIQLLGTVTESGLTTLTVSLDTSGIETANGGIRLRARERFEIIVGPSFPDLHPDVNVAHRRWAGTPHVQWGRHLCLYAAPSVEWNPADGMRGLIARLNLWLQRAAAGELDPAGRPLHPPVAYHSYKHGWVVVRPDLGDLVPWTNAGPERVKLLYAWCAKRGKRIDVLEWLTRQQIIDRLVADDLRAQGENGVAYFAAPLVLISDTLEMEYPTTAALLAGALDTYGLNRDELLRVLVNARIINKAIGVTLEGDDAVPAMMLLGTPARRLEPGVLLAHITAWHLDDLGADITDLLQEVSPEHVELAARVRKLAHDWLGFARLQWMVIHEARPEVTRRRDAGSPLQWLAGKRVLVLGCGALGAPIAEQCIRAGVAQLHVIDKGAVTPGILLRQPYEDADIGYNKAERLATRLSRIRHDLTVTSSSANIVTGTLTDPADLLQYDLIVDATADIGVRVGIERARGAIRAEWPATISALFGHTAQRGVATISLPGATGSGHDILRRLSIDTAITAPAGWKDLADDLFPNPPRTERFFPEPGCSAPTFTGSAAETAALASALLVSAVSVLASTDAEPMTAIGCDLSPEVRGPRPVRLGWRNDVILPDKTGNYEVRINARALAELRTETRRGRRVRGGRIETGGMLLGSFDEATQTVLIDTVAGPSPDSHLSAAYFDHGTEGTQEIVTSLSTATANRVGFVGMWHTHPYGVASPSDRDEEGMADIVAMDGGSRRALMLILGGNAPIWEGWLDSGTLPNIYARVINRNPASRQEGMVAPFLTSSGAWFPGGYTYPTGQFPTGAGERAGIGRDQ
ncbi:ThiF family adenylyltransferase (plasmid) [Paenarthrobacter ureafaciens]|uniref:ThiF family adenylyltransferase n=1 Tax=Micrococcaceae TaxID=1268 RepID=UPI002231ED10|nr:MULTISPECIES: ThiF family adenylyltransferase [Micrococcaceae]MCW3768314.1 ThiF family adenylyltransferase [Paenarthrobacter sp. PAE-2]WJH26795.1 ThiF family adenylyltransferase [Pseudarthrobacter defluvii]